jgi:hypothetical protein
VAGIYIWSVLPPLAAAPPLFDSWCSSAGEAAGVCSSAGQVLVAAKCSTAGQQVLAISHGTSVAWLSWMHIRWLCF